jgi:Zn finger protein HypA/HybF involved in hydrogenase expression
MSELGNSLRCPKCKEFGKIKFQAVTPKDVTDNFECPKCHTKYQRTYSINQFVRMADAGLIDPPDIKDFQRKAMIALGEYIRIDGGLDGAFFIADNHKEALRQIGKMLLCKENRFYELDINKFKKDNIEFLFSCPTCMPKPKKGLIPIRDALILGRAGLIDPSVMSRIRDEYTQETESFDTGSAYTGQDGTLSSWVQEELGMAGEKKSTKCYICGSPVTEGISRCPKCGSDL